VHGGEDGDRQPGEGTRSMSLTSNDPLEVLRALRAVRGSVVVTEADFTSPSGDDVRAIEVPEPGLIHPEHLAWVDAAPVSPTPTPRWAAPSAARRSSKDTKRTASRRSTSAAPSRLPGSASSTQSCLPTAPQGGVVLVERADLSWSSKAVFWQLRTR
jgi:hypothetical protein